MMSNGRSHFREHGCRQAKLNILFSTSANKREKEMLLETYSI